MNKKLWSLIFIFSVLRALVAVQTDLGVDEAHYALYGLFPDLSYFDHPPLIGWIQIPFSFLADHGFGSWRWMARLPVLCAGALATVLTYQWLRLKSFTQEQALWGVMALNLCLLYEGIAVFILPDSLFLILVPALAISVEHLENAKTYKNWLRLGLVLGLCGLSKYTAILFVVALALRWTLQRSLRDLLSNAFWSGVFLAGLLTLPVIIWNLQHDWLSFKYQSGHVMNWENLSIKDFAVSQLSQLFLLGFFYPWLLKSLVQEKSWSFERIFILVCLGFMSLSAAFGNFLPHWTAPAFILGVPWAIALSLQKDYFTRSLKTAFLGASLLFAGINSELIFHWLPAKQSKYLYRDIQGWPDYIQGLSQMADQRNQKLAVTNWTFGSRFMLYAKSRENIFVLDQRIDQFDLWNPASPPHQDFLIAVEPEHSQEFQKQIQCSELSSDGVKPLLWRETELISFEILNCKNFNWK